MYTGDFFVTRQQFKILERYYNLINYFKKFFLYSAACDKSASDLYGYKLLRVK